MYFRRPLLYGLSSLMPYIDTETMNEHYNVHYKKYTDNLNDELEFITNDGSIASIVEILSDYKKYTLKLRQNGGGYYNHFLYFENLSPFYNNFYKDSSNKLKYSIVRDFGSYENFKEQFSKAGADVFGSGWVWLIEKNGILSIVTTANQDNPIMAMSCNVLLGMDVWEHAYYLKHLADRKSYIEDFFKVINWTVVSNRLM